MSGVMNGMFDAATVAKVSSMLMLCFLLLSILLIRISQCAKTAVLRIPLDK